MTFKSVGEAVGTKARKPLPGVKISTADIISAIQKCRGNVSRAADMIGCCRETIERRKSIEPEIQQALQSCRERFLDNLEDVAQNKALSGDSNMTVFLLKQLARKRGYDHDRDVIVESTTRGVLEFIQNRSKNPAES